MDLKYKHLEDAAQKGVLTYSQVEPLWFFLKDQNKDLPQFRAAHILYYLGGLIAIGAMTIFMGLGWESFGFLGVFIICITYGVITIVLTEVLLRRYHLVIPAGIFVTLTLALVPLATFFLLAMLDYWDGFSHYRSYYRYIDINWLIIELATLLAGLLLLFIYRLPFLLMPISFTLWYMGMDIVYIILALLGDDRGMSFWILRQYVAIWFGLAMIVIAFFVDVKNNSPKDFAFWLYLYGVLSFWVALSTLDSGSEFNKFLYCCLNLLMVFIGGMINRRVFTIFGGIGITMYLSYLSYRVFADSILFPFALTFIGLCFIAIGIYWQKHEQQINKAMQTISPKFLRTFIHNKHHE